MIPIDHAAYDGFIFDCDGTLADSMPLHFRAWTESLTAKLGRPSDFTEDQFYRLGGMPARQIVELLNTKYGYQLPVDATAHEKEMDFVHLLPDVQPIPEVVATLQALGRKARVAVASGGLTQIVLATLHYLGLAVGPEEIIKVVFGADQVKQGKPHPELFLKAAEFLQVPPARCLVFEDAEPGFAAARAAGMDFIDVRKYRANLTGAALY